MNQRRCSDADILATSCSPEFETLTVRCRPFYSPREFSSVVFVGVYIPPQDNARSSINNLAAIEDSNPDSTILVLGDFDQTSLTKALPKYRQYIKCNSDHAMIYLVPTYTQKRKSAKPTRKTVKKWTPKAVASLQGCSECTDWCVFRMAWADFDDYTDTVTSYVSFYEESCIPSKTVTIKMQTTKPWFTQDIKRKLVAKQKVSKSKDKQRNKAAKHDAEKATRRAKAQYQQKLEDQLSQYNTLGMWMGLQMIAQYKQKSTTANTEPTLPNQIKPLL